MKKFIFSILSLAATQAWCAEPSDTTQSLGEVTVTAIKQTADLRLQPLATTVVKEPQIERYNITSMKGISQMAPNFYMPDYGSRITSSIYVRGLGARMDQPVVGLNVDNVPFLTKDAYDFDIADIERIEVLRGAQGSLYGRNTMAGQINIYTISPMKWQGSRVLGEISRGPSARLALSHYTKWGNRLAMGFTGNFRFSDGFYKNVYNARNVGTDKSMSLRWRTEWRPSDVVSVSNVAAFALSREGGYPYELKGSDKINYNDTCFYRRNSLSDGLTVRWDAGSFVLSSITSVHYLDDNMTLDQDFTPLNIFTLTQRRHEWTLTQDIVMRGTKGVYTWLAGVYGFMRRGSMHAPVAIQDDGIAQLITDRINNNDRIPVTIAWRDPEINIADDFTLPVWGLAAYHQSNLKLGKWTLGAGLRLDYEWTGIRYNSHTNTGYTVTMPNGMSIPGEINISEAGRMHDHHLVLLPKISASWSLPMPRPSDVYVAVGKGYKSGGFNTQMFSEVVQGQLMSKMMEQMPGAAPATTYSVADIINYRPEKSWNYEAGTHVECAEGRVHCDLALFYIDCRDQQITMFPPGTTTGRITTTAPRSRMMGVEAQIRFAPVAQWLFNLNYGYTNAKFKEFAVGESDFAGNVVPYAPAHTLFGSATYIYKVKKPMALKAIDLTAWTKGAGRIYWNEENSVSQNFYAQLGITATAHFSWLDLELWGTNLTGTKYSVFYFTSMGNDFLQRGAPRRYGLTARLKF